MAPIPLIKAATLTATAIERYLGREVPKRVNERIHLEISEHLKALESSILKSVRRDSYLYGLLTALALVAYFARDLGHLGGEARMGALVFLYVVPLFLTLKFAQRTISNFSQLFRLEEELKSVIRSELDQSGLSRKILLKLFEKRTVDELSQMAVGGFLFQALRMLRVNWRLWVFSLFCYLATYALLFVSRWQI